MYWVVKGRTKATACSMNNTIQSRQAGRHDFVPVFEIFLCAFQQRTFFSAQLTCVEGRIYIKTANNVLHAILCASTVITIS